MGFLFCFISLLLVFVRPCMFARNSENVDPYASISDENISMVDSSTVTGTKRNIEGDITVPEIYKKAIPMISGQASLKTASNFLMQYFLDETSKDFIWPKLARELEDNFNERHSMTDMDRMERHVKDFRDKLDICINEREGRQRSLCLVGFVDLLLANKNDFWWGSTSKSVRFLNFYISFHLVTLSAMQMCRQQFEIAPVKGVDMDKMLQEDLAFFIRQISDQSWEVCQWRKNQITSVEVCKVVDIFRQEYVLYCQDRLVRSEIAKDTNDFMESFRATVTDEMTGKKCYNKRLTVNFRRNKAQTEEALFKEGIKARDECVKAADEECNSYWKQRAHELAEEAKNIKLGPGKKDKEKAKGKRKTKGGQSRS